MLKLSSAFFEAAEREAATRWDREVAAELIGLHPRHFAALGAQAKAVERFCRTVRDYALAYHVTGRRETYRLVVVGLALGAHVPHDPRFALLIERTLAEVDIPQDRRVTRLCDGAEAWIGATSDGAGLDVRGASLVERIRRWGEGATARAAVEAALHGLVLQSPTIAPPERRAAFLDAVLSQADGYGLREPWRRLAYAGGALLHGVYWFDDPLMAGLRGAVTTAADAGAMCDRLDAIYGRFA